MKILSRKKSIAVMLVILAVIFWTGRIIPSGLCIITAARYVNDKYPDRDFKYSFVEYSSAHGEYFVHFVDENGERIAIMTSPFSVRYDPLDVPN